MFFVRVPHSIHSLLSIECMKLEAALTNKENELKMKSKEVAYLQRKLSQLKGKTDS